MAKTEIEIHPDEAIMSRQEILKMLNKHQVPWDTWGKAGNRTLEDLFNYHEKDRLYFRNGSSEQCTIDVHAAIVVVTHKGDDGWRELYEDRQVFSDGSEIRRDSFNGIAETAKRSEATMNDTAKRCLLEELNFNDPLLYELSDCIRIEHRKPMKSEKWPGIIAVYHRYLFDCIISDRLFRSDGYIEKERERTVYFKWKKLPNQLELSI